MERKKPIVVCRPLFYTVIKYIYLISLAILLIVNSCIILFNKYRTFGKTLVIFIIYLIGFALLYLLFNWIYKCVLKTMLALTDKEIRFEFYRPFIKYKSTLPLGSIQKVSTFNCFGIFRLIIINQYHKIPLIFPTWNNEEMKEEIDKLIINEKEEVLNEGKFGGLISKKNYKKSLIIVSACLGALIIIAGLVNLINGINNKKYIGTFKASGVELKLEENGECVYNDYSDCTWSGYKESGIYYVDVTYQYEEEYGYYYTYTTTETDSFTARLNFDKKTYHKVSY